MCWRECGAGIAPEDTAVRIRTSSAGAVQLCIAAPISVGERSAGKEKASFQWEADLKNAALETVALKSLPRILCRENCA
jgi:hypothetical protein